MKHNGMNSFQDLINIVEDLLRKSTQYLSNNPEIAAELCERGLEIITQLRDQINLSNTQDHMDHMRKRLAVKAFFLHYELLRNLAHIFMQSGKCGHFKISEMIDILVLTKMSTEYERVRKIVCKASSNPIPLSIKLEFIKWWPRIFSYIGDFSGAIALSDLAIRSLEKMYGKKNKKCIIPLLDIARIHAYHGNICEAWNYLSRVFEIMFPSSVFSLEKSTILDVDKLDEALENLDYTLFDHTMILCTLIEILISSGNYELAYRLSMDLLKTLHSHKCETLTAIYEIEAIICEHKALMYSYIKRDCFEKAKEECEFIMNFLSGLSAQNSMEYSRIAAIYGMILADKDIEKAFQILRKAVSIKEEYLISRIASYETDVLRISGREIELLFSLVWRYISSCRDMVKEKIVKELANHMFRWKSFSLYSQIPIAFASSDLKSAIARLFDICSKLYESIENNREDAQINLSCQLREIEKLVRDKSSSLLPHSFQPSTIREELRKISWEEVANRLPEDAVLVEFVSFKPIFVKEKLDHRYVAFVLRRNRNPVMIDLGEINQINSNILRLLKNMENMMPFKELCESLYNMIFSPMEEFINGVSHIIELVAKMVRRW